VGWGGELEEKGKTHGLGGRQFSRMAKREECNNNKIGKKNVQNAIYSVPDAQFTSK